MRGLAGTDRELVGRITRATQPAVGGTLDERRCRLGRWGLGNEVVDHLGEHWHVLPLDHVAAGR